MTMSNIALSQLAVLAEIASSGSFSVAAGRLGMTQSGASQAIRQLEGVLGARLLHRGPKGVTPTDLGAAIVREARVALDAVARIRQCSRSAATLAVGRLRIGAVASAAARVLPAPLAKLQRDFPGVDVGLLEGTDSEVRHWTEEHIVDVGLTAETSGKLIAAPVAEDDFLCVLARQHRLAGRGSIRLRDIATEPFLMSASGCEPAIRRLFAAGGSAPRVSLYVRDTRALTTMVEQGLGVSVVPRLSLPERTPGLVAIALVPRARRRLLLVRRPDSAADPAIDALLARIRATSARLGAAPARLAAVRPSSRRG